MICALMEYAQVYPSWVVAEATMIAMTIIYARPTLASETPA